MIMKTGVSGERVTTFGKRIQSVRYALDLTQAELAKQLGVSQQTMRNWETGKSAPKPEHLKRFIELALRGQVFAAGQKEEEIRTLWKAAHQNVPLDEAWLKALLADQLCQQESIVPFPGGTICTESASPNTGPQVDWGEALIVPTLYGREQELEMLSNWIVQERCRVVSVLGMGGIGKSALAVKTMLRLADQFESVLFRSLRDAPSCEALLDGCLQTLSSQSEPIPGSLNQRVALLLEHLARRRTLLVLDNMESVLDEGEQAGRFRAGFEGYEYLVSRIAQGAHQSCLLLTSREQAAPVRLLESRYAFMRTLRLSGLDLTAGERLLSEKEVRGTQEEKVHLIERYTGNPLALRIVSETIADRFAGQIDQFLAAGPVVFGSLSNLLNEHWVRLSQLEQNLLRWLAIVREPVTLEGLRAVMVEFQAQGILNALDRLSRRALIERGHRAGSFTLQSVVLEYVTDGLVTMMTEEIEHSHMDLLIQHGLELAQSKDYLRQAQDRMLLKPILAHVQQSMELRSAAVEEQLLSLLEQIRTWEEDAQGYGPANLIALLRLVRGDLRGLDLSQLCLRGASLQGVEMQDARLCRAMLRDTTFTEAMHAIWSVAISPTGKVWAAGSWRGDVRIWHEEGQRLSLAWQAHSDNLFTLALSPDERTLATGSWDRTVKLWDVHSGALLWTGWHTDMVFSVAFSPDGRTLASSGNDALIQLWDVPTGKLVHRLKSQGGGVYSVVWSPDERMLASGYRDGSIEFWQLQADQAPMSSFKLVGHTNWARCLAFSPDGTQLASGDWDGLVKLWDVTNRRVLQTLTGHTQRIHSIAWSPDGCTVASASVDKTIRLWDVAQQRYRAVLYGHSGVVNYVAFTPDSRCLLSGSEDSTLRLWEVSSGQCLRTIEGYAVSLSNLDWSPDSTHLISGSADGLVIVWDVTGKTPSRVLGSHQWIVWGVGWSPDGRWLVSAGWDNTIRIWEPTTGACQQILRDPDHEDTMFLSMACSPDACWLATGTYLYGIYLWDARKHCRRWVGQPYPTSLRSVVWSPDGTQLASGGDDGKVCLWESATGRLLQCFLGHHGAVHSVAWSPDGTLLASASGGTSGGELLVWEVQSGVCLQAFTGLPPLVAAVTWNQRGDRLISGGSDGRLCWWEVQSGKCLHECQAHEGTILSLKRSPDGTWLASGGDDGAIRIWDLHRGELVQTLRRDRPYERMNITGIQGLTEAQKATLRALGAVEDALENRP
jgi:WD40 repeat protein/transcriptional regulator with XRE-family HTH domain